MEFGMLLEKAQDSATQATEDEDRRSVTRQRSKVKEGARKLKKLIERLNAATLALNSVELDSWPISYLGSTYPAIYDLLKQLKDQAATLTSFRHLVNKIPERDLKSHVAHGALGFEFEEQQLYFLRELSLGQKEFVAGKFNTLVVETLEKVNARKESSEIDQIALVRGCFGKMAADIEIVQRAIVQRVHEVDEGGTYAPSMQASALLITDQLALRALEPFRHLFRDNPKITPITFFSQETHVQSVPYRDDVILIGIRYDQVLQSVLEGNGTEKATNGGKPPLPFELLAIPHEIGHYVFQRADNAQVQQSGKRVTSNAHALNQANQPSISFEDIVERLSIADPRHKAWCEEIFADICGCIVAGPLVALSMLSILASRADEMNRESDGEHPTGILRPFILKEILDQLYGLRPKEYNFTNASDQLIKTWKGILRDLGYGLSEWPRKVTINPAESDEFIICIEDELEAIKPIIKAFTEILIGSKPITSKLGYGVWCKQDHKELQKYESDLLNIANVFENQHGGAKTRKASKREVTNTLAHITTLPELFEEWEKKGPVTIGGHH